MNGRKLAALGLVAVVMSLTACEGDSPTNLADTGVADQTYRGQKLHCVKTGAGRTATLTCDFVKFYAKNPELLEDKSESAEDGVEWISEAGKPLACVKLGAGDSKRWSCDWQRLYANHPSAFDR